MAVAASQEVSRTSRSATSQAALEAAVRVAAARAVVVVAAARAVVAAAVGSRMAAARADCRQAEEAAAAMDLAMAERRTKVVAKAATREEGLCAAA